MKIKVDMLLTKVDIELQGRKGIIKPSQYLVGVTSEMRIVSCNR